MRSVFKGFKNKFKKIFVLLQSKLALNFFYRFKNNIFRRKITDVGS